MSRHYISHHSYLLISFQFHFCHLSFVQPPLFLFPVYLFLFHQNSLNPSNSKHILCKVEFCQFIINTRWEFGVLYPFGFLVILEGHNVLGVRDTCHSILILFLTTVHIDARGYIILVFWYKLYLSYSFNSTILAGKVEIDQFCSTYQLFISCCPPKHKVVLLITFSTTFIIARRHPSLLMCGVLA